MDYPILVAATRVLRDGIRGSSVADVRRDGRRFRLVFVDPAGAPRTLLIAVDPQRPWYGRPTSRAPRSRRIGGSFEAALRRALLGLVVADLEALPERCTSILALADGHRLIIRLAPHRANLILQGPDGAIVESMRPDGKEGSRTPEPIPTDPAGLDARVGALSDQGIELATAIARAWPGLGRETSRLVAEETRVAGRSAGTILFERIAAVESGELAPVVLAPPGSLDVGPVRLFPWMPSDVPAHLETLRAADAAATVTMYHEALDRAEERAARRGSIAATLTREERRTRRSLERVRDDLARFAGAEVHRRHGEALLAGLSRAIREGDSARVPDPYATEGQVLVVPAPAGRPLAECAEECFRRHRRAVRGHRHASARLSDLEGRLRGLLEVGDLLRQDLPSAADRAERRLRELGVVPVTARSSGDVRPAVQSPRAAGVRTFVGPGGETVLAGRSGTANDRVTFRLATPDDIWLHADGVPGAHVILRAVPGQQEPDPESLRFAAGIAAWFSDSREAVSADVRWARRRLVRRIRGRRDGTVVVKRFRVIRVRPAAPREIDDAP